MTLTGYVVAKHLTNHRILIKICKLKIEPIELVRQRKSVSSVSSPKSQLKRASLLERKRNSISMEKLSKRDDSITSLPTKNERCSYVRYSNHERKVPILTMRRKWMMMN